MLVVIFYIILSLSCIIIILVASPLVFPVDEWIFYMRVKAWADAAVLLLQLLIAASSAPADDDSGKEEESHVSDNYSFIVED
jgi:hypothetical protein